MAVAVTVVILANIIGYTLGVVIFVSILAAPLAVGAFLVCRYLLYGRALPDALANKS
ncbi:hypothetical protein [Halorientalis sp.]|uniref:hypothetical protein n=1 Tax=Halorientalis sp. TaxID=1931229 RepID=UPI0026196D76|nr:hypothetical protein [Halorientalis sp.]